MCMHEYIYFYVCIQKKNIYEFYIGSEYMYMYSEKNLKKNIYVYIFFSRFFSVIGYYKTLSIVPWGV